MNPLVTTEIHDGVAVVTIANPPVNALSPGVPEGIDAAIAAANQNGAVVAIVLIGGGNTFIAGADITQFEKIRSGQVQRGEGLLPLLRRIEDTSKPVVAAIHGNALGGGLETAMACHYRVAVAGAAVGQPEVKLGLIPGAGGTQRLPRLVGLALAAEMCAGGEPLTAEKARQAGLLDEIITGDLRTAAIAFARARAAESRPLPRTRLRDDRLDDTEPVAAKLAAMRLTYQKRGRGFRAPLAAMDAVEAARLDFDEGCAIEQRLFNECLFSTQSQAMIHQFFGNRTVAKIPDVPRDTAQFPIASAGILGGGTMGTGIAMTYASAGIKVWLRESDPQRLEAAMDRIRGLYRASAEKGKLTASQVEQCLERIHPTLDIESFANVDIVVEAVFEEMDLKKSVFAELNRVTRPDCILASNTSSLDIDQIAAATDRPQMVIGHHFFSPANVMRLLEIVRGEKTSKEVIATSMALAKRLKKVGVLVGNCRGFVGNRMYGPYQREAQFLLEEGATVPQVDRAMEQFGMALGPLATGDLSGLDVGWRIRKAHRHLIPAGQRVAKVADRLCEIGRYGQKTSAGWYRYEPGKRTPVVDPEVQTLIEQVAAENEVARREITDQEIVDRLLLALILEGARILEEKMALRAVDIDVIYVNGYGFPPHVGGPMFHADRLGLKVVQQKIAGLREAHGDLWAPCKLLEDLADQGKSFADFDRQFS